MSILVDATIKKGVILPKRKLDLEEHDVIIKIEPAHRESALKTRISASLELVNEVLESEPDKFM